jgi:glycosyltransferase involved in cell wall biosynthesis
MDEIATRAAALRPSLAARLLQPAAFFGPPRTADPGWLCHAPFAFWLAAALRPARIVEVAASPALAQAAGWLGLPRPLAVAPGSPVDPPIEGRPIDLLHLEGDAAAESVARALPAWRAALSEGAVILLHGTRAGGAAARLWAEQRAHAPAFELPHGQGLGLLGIGDAAAEPVRWLLDLAAEDPEAATEAAALFAALGRAAIPQDGDAAAARELAEARHQAVLRAVQLSRSRDASAAARRQRDGLVAELMQVEERCREAERRAQIALDEARAAAEALAGAAEAMATLEAGRAAAAAEAAALARQIEAMRRSRSWRLTQPLRVASRVAAALRRPRATTEPSPSPPPSGRREPAAEAARTETRAPTVAGAADRPATGTADAAPHRGSPPLAGRPGRRLLVLDDEVPLRALGAGFPRMAAILGEAAAAGWSVTFYPVRVPDIDWAQARAELPREIELVPDRGSDGLAGFLAERRGHHEVVLVSRPENMAVLRAALRRRPDLLDGTALVYDAEALFAARTIARRAVEGRPVTPAEAAATIAAELALAEGSDAVTCVSEAEAAAFRTRLGVPARVLSHPTVARRAAPGFQQRRGFLFVGRLLEPDSPNWQGLAWFVREAWPLIRAALPDARLVVAGRLAAARSERAAPGVDLVGPVPDLGPLYDAARVFVAPVRFAAGVPIKILEAAAAGLPVVGTNLMAAQLGWTDGIAMAASDAPSELAAAALALQQDETRWQAMRAAAGDRVAREHGAARFRTRLLGLLEDAALGRAVD